MRNNDKVSGGGAHSTSTGSISTIFGPQHKKYLAIKIMVTTVAFAVLGIVLYVANRVAFQVALPQLLVEQDRSRISEVEADGAGFGATWKHHIRDGAADYNEAPAVFQCPPPKTSQLSTFNYDYTGEAKYLNEQPDVDDHNVTQTFRNEVFDGWSLTFAEVKESVYPFKKQYYVPYLKSGDHIFESASGLGLNLYLTLEILQEEAGISNITVYGNEYLETNVVRSQRLLNKLFDAQQQDDIAGPTTTTSTTTSTTTKNHVGAICHGDSADLSFVPANSFDLVFTGYISPLWDPLELQLPTEAELKRVMTHLCGQAARGSQAQRLVAEMQRRQEEWFSNWFQQMIRIAKPGAPVIIEEVAPPRCDKLKDFGGVSKDFWRKGIDTYHWDVNASTLEFGARAEKYDKQRYHVFMKKNER